MTNSMSLIMQPKLGCSLKSGTYIVEVTPSRLFTWKTMQTRAIRRSDRFNLSTSRDAFSAPGHLSDYHFECQNGARGTGCNSKLYRRKTVVHLTTEKPSEKT